jgi:hypothetical protein
MTEQELCEAVQHTIIGALLGTLSIGGATDAIMLVVQQFCAGKGGTPPADDCEWDRTVTRYYEGGESDED